MSLRENPKFAYEFEWQINPHPGLFVVVEGLDGSGNDTQVDRLASGYFFDHVGLNSLAKIESEPTHGPFGAPVNFAIRRGLVADNRTLQLGFTTDRSDHLTAGKIEENLKKGWPVLMKRYVASSIAYGYAAGLPIDWLISLQSQFILPDLMFYLQVPVDVCMKRIEMRAKQTGQTIDLYENRGFLEKVADGYELLATKIPRLTIGINGNRRIMDITDEIVDFIEKHPKEIQK